MKINIASKEIIHSIGIGGIGMSGLAQIMKNMGFMIQGSDLNKNKNTERLIKLGIKPDMFFTVRHTKEDWNGNYRKTYVWYHQGMTEDLSDRGKWFDLEYLAE